MIVANDIVANRMAGPGIRCVELARALDARGHAVTIVAPEGSGLVGQPFELKSGLSPEAVDHLARLQDAIVLESISVVRYPFLLSVPVPLIFDLYDPFPIALLEQEAHRPVHEQVVENRGIERVLRDILSAGDYFLCASDSQRDLWLGALLSAGRINPHVWARDKSLQSLVGVVPFGLPSEAPRSAGPDRIPLPGIGVGDVVLLWAGGIYNWFDPLTLISAVGDVAQRRSDIRLVFMSTSHPNPSIPSRMWMSGEARSLAAKLGLLDRSVFFNDAWVPYESRADWLLASTCGVSTHFEHAEARYAFRTRMLDYLWAGLPIICTEGDVFAELVRERQLGWVVPAEDKRSLAEAIDEMARDGERRKVIADRVRAVAQEFTWSRVATPLVTFCETPSFAADQPRRRMMHRKPPTKLGLRLRRAMYLGKIGLYELSHGGALHVAKQARKWWLSRRSATN